MYTAEQIKHAASTMEPGNEVLLQVGQRVLQFMAVDGAGRVAWFIDGRLANIRRAREFLDAASANASASA